MAPLNDPTISIRPMLPGDVDAVRELDAQAFTGYLRQRGVQDSRPLRTRENVLAGLAINPEGCFVAEADRPVGYIFSRCWGLLGWVGVFGVHPDRHGQGIGRRLLTAAVARLEAAGCTTIGLETMPDSPYNVGLYTSMGFRPGFSTLTLEREVQAPAGDAPFRLLSQLEQGAALAAVTAISQEARPGLDYAPEALNALRFSWGETLLMGWPEPWALAIVRTIAAREGQGETSAAIGTLAIRPAARGRPLEVVQAVESLACERGLRRITVAVNAADWVTLQMLREAGLRIVHLGLRMLLRGQWESSPGVDHSRWAM